MISLRTKRALRFAFLAVSFVGIFPLSVRLADPLFTHPFRSDWRHPVLLIWPDHVEMRWFYDVAEVSPRPKSATYTFNIAPERQAWVENKVRSTPSPNGNAVWIIHVKQLGPSRQRVQLELLGDGISGIVYEARPDEVVPLRSRVTGAGGAFVILAVHALLWGGFWLLVWVVSRLFARYRRKAIPSYR